MSDFTDDQAANILDAVKRHYQNGSSDWSDVYQTIIDNISSANVDPAVLIWIAGAKNVNTNNGAFAQYIRQYTANQYQYRTGNTLSDATLQKASDTIAARFSYQLLFNSVPPEVVGFDSFFDSSTGGAARPLDLTVPNLHSVGAIDASAAASKIFLPNGNGDPSPTSTGKANSSPWAGTVLFTQLGDSSFLENWMLQPDGNHSWEGGVKIEPGAYDLISAAEDAASLASPGNYSHPSLEDAIKDILKSTYTGLSLYWNNSQSIGNAMSKIDSFLTDMYGSEASKIDVASVILNPAVASTTSKGAFVVGKISGDKLSTTDKTEFLVGGEGDDYITAAAALSPINTESDPNVPTGPTSLDTIAILDGGGGNNVLDYSGDASSLDVELQTSQLQETRLKIDPGPGYRTDYAYNFDTLKGNGQLNNHFHIAKSADPATANNDLPGISSVSLSVSMEPSNRGEMSATIYNTDGATSSMTISGFPEITLSSGNDTVDFAKSQSGPSDNGTAVPASGLPAQTPVSVAGGDGDDVFNVDYSKGITGSLLLDGGEGDDTFNITDADEASETVLWGGSGSNTFNISTSGNAEADLLTINVAGLTSDNFRQLDIGAFDAYLNQNYGVDPHRIVVLNADSDDILKVNGTNVSDPTQFLLTGVDTYFFGMQYVSDSDTDNHPLSQGPGTTIDGYTGSNSGFVPDQYNDQTSVYNTYGLTDGTSIFSAGASWEDTYGTWHLHIGTPSDVSVSTNYNTYGNSVLSTAQNLDPSLYVDPADHTKIDDSIGIAPIYDSQGQQIGYDYQGSGNNSPVGVSQYLNTSKGVNIENLTQGAFGLNMTADQDLPFVTNINSLYNVGSWASYEVKFHQPDDFDGGPSNVIGYVPNFANSTLVSSDSQSINFEQSVSSYFDYGSQVTPVDISSMLRTNSTPT